MIAGKKARPELALDPVAVMLGMVLIALWRARRNVARQSTRLEAALGAAELDCKRLRESREVNEILAAHTQRLSAELFLAEAQLQAAIRDDVDPAASLFDCEGCGS